LYSYLGLGFRG